MNLRFVVRDAGVWAELAERSRERTRNTFQRFSHWIREVVVRLTDLNGPKGGIDKSVSVEIVTLDGQTIRVRSRGESYDRSLGNALGRARRQLLASPHAGARRPLRGTLFRG
jgi:hypothetical protein